MQIIPTTGLQNDFFKMERWIGRIKDYSRWIQVDVCDGTFTFGKTFELEQLGRLDLNTSSLLWDIHLMVKDPINYVEKCMFIGASRIIGQVEMMSDRKVKDWKWG
jgi:pentose-5-phosphate-3-epimerase